VARNSHLAGYEGERSPATPLYLIRHLKHWSQAELADRAGCTRETISHLERGAQRPKLETAASLSHVLGVPVDVLFPPEREGLMK
jgi:transcriptional regulator with XRE-family HTH domain